MLKQQVNGDPNTVFILGHDVLGQANGTSNPKYLLYDGHGSVRQLADSAGTVTANYAYDAYGNAHGFNPADAATSMLYTGEMYDSSAAMYYLRARYYDPLNGRFNRMDPFAGNNRDPQSLHKYLYAHCNPINGIDPSGEFFVSLISFMWVQAKTLYMRSQSAVTTWKQYTIAKKLMTVAGVSYVISTAIVNYLSGAAELELDFPKCSILPKRKIWPKVTLGLTTDRRYFTVDAEKSGESVDSMSGMMGTGGGRLHGKLDLETGTITGNIGANLALQVFPFNSEIKSPVKAKFEGKIEGPPVEAIVGISISFGSPIKAGNWLTTGISTGFSLLKINRSGISLLWGQPWDPIEELTGD